MTCRTHKPDGQTMIHRAQDFLLGNARQTTDAPGQTSALADRRSHIGLPQTLAEFLNTIFHIGPILSATKSNQFANLWKSARLGKRNRICNAPTTQIYRWFNFVTWSNGTRFQFFSSIIAIDRHQWEAIKSEQLWFGLFQCWSCIYFPLHWLFGGNSDNKEMSKHC